MSKSKAKRLADALWPMLPLAWAVRRAAAAELLRQEAEILRLRKVEEEWMRLSQDDGKAEREIAKLREELGKCQQQGALVLELATALKLVRKEVAETGNWVLTEHGWLTHSQVIDAVLAKVPRS